MKITVLCGSARPNANSLAYSKAFKEGAESVGHEVEIVNIAQMNIAGCRGCEYCHTEGNGKCVQRDDMDKVWEKLEGAELVVLASPVYYWSFSGQMQSTITRFYCKGLPSAQKYAMILSSGSPGVYDSIINQYKSILSYGKKEDAGVLTFNGDDQPDKYLDEVREFAKNIK